MLFVINSRPAPSTADPDKPVEPVVVKEKTENITVIKALRDLPAGSLLRSSDYQAETISVPVNSGEKANFALSFDNVAEYGLKFAIKQDSFIPMASLVPPSTSAEYIQMSLQNGMLVYPFTLTRTDTYLLSNLKQGDLIDIYLAYGADQRSIGQQKSVELVSPTNSFMTTRIKPIVTNRRLLLIDKVQQVTSSGVNDNVDGSRLFVELSQAEVKLLKSLEGNAKIFLFPSIDTDGTVLDDSQILLGDEAAWPVSTNPIFNLDAFGRSIKSQEVKELRGK
ncbi:CpaB family protein [Zophobihabitans entericus]|uniref:Uncharacterized protein n=1 Tax=Zophobihabitans entericus TaxID=1635327 RepID=A0A6G9IAQ1_9GAMM|nr:hypothetical protein [Zophobihabitans entericus]QIQ21308.1 hypothetical protein IPMB12_06175 [Zophobihabitans entericus]